MGRARILTTHVGSLPRSAAVLEALRVRASALHDTSVADELEKATREIVRKQVNVGIDIVSDGEISKPSCSTYVTKRWKGFGDKFLSPIPRDMLAFEGLVKESGADWRLRQMCIAELQSTGSSELQDDISRFTSAVQHAKPLKAFMNAASPGLVAYFMRNQYYHSFEAYLAAMVPLLRQEYEAILSAGFDLQLDCPELALGRHIGYADDSDAEFIRKSEASIEALNAATEGLPGSRMRIHICWGNYPGPHHFDLPLERVLPLVFRARPSMISFEGANPRHEHEYKVFDNLRLPDGKIILPGLIDSTSNFIEHPELVAQRLKRYVKRVGHDRVIASTDCGFSTSASGGHVNPEVVWAKLESLVLGARIASNEI